MIAEEFALGFQGLLDGPLDDGLTHIDGQRLDGIEVDVEPGPFIPEGTSGDDFPPPVSQVAKVGRIVGLTLGEWHRGFVLELANKSKMGISS